MIDVETGKMQKNKKELTWLMTDEQCNTGEKIFDIRKETIYRLKVQESLAFQREFLGMITEVAQGTKLLVCDVLERDCHEERLEAILAEFQKPVVLHVEGCDELRLDKSLGLFSGEGVWNGDKCRIHFEVDADGEETAEEVLATWNMLLQNCEEWDKKAREYAAKELVDSANDWLCDGAEEDEEIEKITEVAFAQRMELSEVCVSLDGDFEIYYDDDDMFWGHSIVVSGNIDEGICDATMAG